MLDSYFELKPSKWFAVILLVLHTLVIASIIPAPLFPLHVQLALVALVLLNLLFQLNRYALLRGGASWRGFMLEENRLLIDCRSGRQWSGKVLPYTVCFSTVIVLAVKPDDHSFARYQVLFADALKDDLFRTLSVRLRFMPDRTHDGRQSFS